MKYMAIRRNFEPYIQTTSVTTSYSENTLTCTDTWSILLYSLSLNDIPKTQNTNAEINEKSTWGKDAEGNVRA
jgi:hypothetical protein